MKNITPRDLASVGRDAVLVDVREPAEFACQRLAGSRNIPLSRIEQAGAELDKGRTIVLICRSGRRSQEAAKRLAALGFTDLVNLDGGVLALEAAGCALEKGKGSVWPMERQVRMASGALVLAGIALGVLVNEAFCLLSAFVGLGLMYSAATDTCGMARVLALMPWNRSSNGPACGRPA